MGFPFSSKFSIWVLLFLSIYNFNLTFPLVSRIKIPTSPFAVLPAKNRSLVSFPSSLSFAYAFLLATGSLSFFRESSNFIMASNGKSSGRSQSY